MGEIVVHGEYNNFDRDSIWGDIYFNYLNDNIIDDSMTGCHLSYSINDSYGCESYRLVARDIVLTVDDGKWNIRYSNYKKEVMKAFIELIEDIEKRFNIRIPVKM